MSAISDKMHSKGYAVLGENAFGAISFKRSMKKDSSPLSNPVWFDIKQTMKDSKGNTIRCTVAATDRAQYEEYIGKGWIPVEPGESLIIEEAKIERTGKDTKSNRENVSASSAVNGETTVREGTQINAGEGTKNSRRGRKPKKT